MHGFELRSNIFVSAVKLI